MSTDHISGHTYVKGRSFSRKRKNPADLPWTAKRCQHLLRQIVVPLTALHRAREMGVVLQGKPFKTPPRHNVRSSVDQQSVCATPCVPTPPTAGKDPDWIPKPGKTNPNVIRKYGGGGKRREDVRRTGRPGATSKNGAIVIATPYLRRIACGPVLSSPAESADSMWQDMDFRDSEPVNDAARELVAGRRLAMDNSFESLKGAIIELLRATDERPDGFVPRRGAPSFLSMCLRRIPAVIAIEKRDQEHVPPQDRMDVTSAMYADLEELGPGVGWRHLREVVRAHGIALLIDAIEDGLVPEDRCLELLEYMKSSAKREVELVFEALIAAEDTVAVNHEKVLNNNILTPDPRSLSSKLCSYVDYSRYSRLACQFFHSNQEGLLQLSTLWGWTHAAVSLANPRQCTIQPALELVETGLRQVLRHNEGWAGDASSSERGVIAMGKTLTCLFRVVATVAITGVRLKQDPVKLGKCLWVLKALGLDVMMRLEAVGCTNIGRAARRCASTTLCMVLLVMQYYSAEATGLLSVKRVVTAMRKLDNGVSNSHAKLICSIARRCSKTSSSVSSLQFIKEFATHMIKYSPPEKERGLSQEVHQYLTDLAMATVLQFAHDEDDEETQAFLGEMERRLKIASIEEPRVGHPAKAVQPVDTVFKDNHGVCCWYEDLDLDLLADTAPGAGSLTTDGQTGADNLPVEHSPTPEPTPEPNSTPEPHTPSPASSPVHFRRTWYYVSDPYALTDDEEELPPTRIRYDWDSSDHDDDDDYDIPPNYTTDEHDEQDDHDDHDELFADMDGVAYHSPAGASPATDAIASRGQSSSPSPPSIPHPPNPTTDPVPTSPNNHRNPTTRKRKHSSQSDISSASASESTNSNTGTGTAAGIAARKRRRLASRMRTARLFAEVDGAGGRARDSVSGEGFDRDEVDGCGEEEGDELYGDERDGCEEGDDVNRSGAGADARRAEQDEVDDELA